MCDLFYVILVKNVCYDCWEGIEGEVIWRF